MGILDDVRRLLGGKPITGGARVARREVESAPLDGEVGSSAEIRWDSSATPPPNFDAAPETLPVQVLTQGPLTDLKRLAKYLAAAGVESQLVMPPGGCGT